MSNFWRAAVVVPRTVLVVMLSIWGAACAGPGTGNEWQGLYVYYSDQGRTAGGSTIGTEYTLTIGNNSSDCTLKIQGFQVDEVILCTVGYESSRADVQFVSYEDGSVKNPYGVQLYEPREVLFSLEQSDPQMVTIWHSLTPDEEPVEKGTYFEKQVPAK